MVTLLCNMIRPTNSKRHRGELQYDVRQKRQTIGARRRTKEECIRERAYDKWEQAGRPEGMSERFWQDAEREYSASPEAEKAVTHETAVIHEQAAPLAKSHLRYLTAVLLTKMFSI